MVIRVTCNLFEANFAILHESFFLFFYAPLYVWDIEMFTAPLCNTFTALYCDKFSGLNLYERKEKGGGVTLDFQQPFHFWRLQSV